MWVDGLWRCRFTFCWSVFSEHLLLLLSWNQNRRSQIVKVYSFIFNRLLSTSCSSLWGRSAFIGPYYSMPLSGITSGFQNSNRSSVDSCCGSVTEALILGSQRCPSLPEGTDHKLLSRPITAWEWGLTQRSILRAGGGHVNQPELLLKTARTQNKEREGRDTGTGPTELFHLFVQSFHSSFIINLSALILFNYIVFKTNLEKTPRRKLNSKDPLSPTQ